MWQKIKPILGVLLILVSLNGVRMWVFDGEKPLARDLEAVGTIVSLEARTYRVAPLVSKTDHYISYSFPAADGQTYSKQFAISPEEYASLRKGQRVRVRYHSDNPSINAIDGFRHYSSVAELDKYSARHSPAKRGGLLLGLFLLGGYLVWSWFSSGPTSVTPSAPTSRTGGGARQVPARIPTNRLAGAQRGAAPRPRGT